MADKNLLDYGNSLDVLRRHVADGAREGLVLSQWQRQSPHRAAGVLAPTSDEPKPKADEAAQ